MEAQPPERISRLNVARYLTAPFGVQREPYENEREARCTDGWVGWDGMGQCFFPVKKRVPSVKIFEFPYVKIWTLPWKYLKNCPWNQNSVREKFTQISYVKLVRSMREKKSINIQLKVLVISIKQKMNEK